MTLTRDDLVVGVTIPGFFVLSVASMIACGHAFPAMHVWRSGINAQAALGTAIMVAFVPAFVAARFSFGYLVGFSLLSAVFGFVWLSFFSAFDYPHAIARWAMIAALAAAMIPLMLQNIPVWRPGLSEAAVKRIAVLLLASCLAVLVADVSYGANLGDPYGAARTAVVRPALLNYLTGIMIGAVLPYLFAHFASRRRWMPAAGVLLLALCFYPVVNNKTVLLLPIWLPFLFWLYGRFDPRLATVVAFLIPMIIGLSAFAILGVDKNYIVFSTINLRFVAIPSLALDQYADFFAHHELTRFCQISILRYMAACPYGELGPTLGAIYQDGNFNASFLATEGIASVGLALAPVSAFVCGLTLSVGSMVSKHLSPRFIAVSSGIAVQAIMNVPLTTGLLSNGIALLFLLWWLTPEQRVASSVSREQAAAQPVGAVGLAAS
ncbi:hypothetical protein ABIF38_006231 [Bradyrhizobium japonicum]|jgi:hypothetical protein|uniref:Uncharacterized protein n=2 Tax=Bradyrhizobium elkanii TaxID=29448 RepID=A0ABV4F2R5_BRAEL|nr:MULTISPECIES: hypothetical protein [Bradyrhizobium]MBP2426369.1 hypothetical protein [Bradyrhizobium elkanii]MCP1731462.1 hypothetical protein [Bradyrhizobium elkanii]MCP1758410.1 hypothetical protein [Bradyrhizobium elkanii]MCP1931983.1 hypothetical protein [Bradyrhizobium elkanii]MCP1983726.1 hypothetical protein [Bradyrhizobium elkanii]